MLMEELLCPVINTITSEVKVIVIDFYISINDKQSQTQITKEMGKESNVVGLMDAQYRECGHSQE